MNERGNGNKIESAPQDYAQIERGDTCSNLDSLKQISEVFEIDMIELLWGRGKISFNNFANIRVTKPFNYA